VLRVVTIVVASDSLAFATRNEFRAYPVEALQITFTVIVSSTIALAFTAWFLNDNEMTGIWLVAITHPIKSNPGTVSRILANVFN